MNAFLILFMFDCILYYGTNKHIFNENYAYAYFSDAFYLYPF